MIVAGLLTLAIIKPHIVRSRQSGKIIARIEEEGFGILQSKITQLRPEGARDFYKKEQEKDFFFTLVQQMTAGAIWVLVLSKPNAVEEWNKLLGATNPREAEPGTLRFDFGDHENPINNAVHGSATDFEAKREINFFFARELKIAQRVLEIEGQE